MEIFDNGFNNQCAIGEVSQIFDRTQAGRCFFGSCYGQLAFFRHFFELGANAGNGTGGGIRPGIEQLDGMASSSGNLGDTCTHGASADDGDDSRLRSG